MLPSIYRLSVSQRLAACPRQHGYSLALGLMFIISAKTSKSGKLNDFRDQKPFHFRRRFGSSFTGYFDSHPLRKRAAGNFIVNAGKIWSLVDRKFCRWMVAGEGRPLWLTRYA